MKQQKINILIILFLFTFLYLHSAPIKQKISASREDQIRETIIVDIDGTGDYTTIQEGIDAAEDGDLVLVYPGTYYENINYNSKNIIVASKYYTTGNETYIDSTIIDGNQNGSCVLVNSGEYDAKISGFTLENGTGFYTNDMHFGSQVPNSGGKCIPIV